MSERFLAEVHNKGKTGAAADSGDYGIPKLLDASIDLHFVNDQARQKLYMDWGSHLRQVEKGSRPGNGGVLVHMVSPRAMTEVTSEYLHTIVEHKKRGNLVPIYFLDGPPNNDTMRLMNAESALHFIVKRNSGTIKYPIGEVPTSERQFWLEGPPKPLIPPETVQQVETKMIHEDTISKTYDKQYETLGENWVRVDALKAADFDPVAQQEVFVASTLVSQEFVSLCPWSGMPDFGLLSITYQPQHKVVEFKSLKYYLTSYKDVGITQERAVQKICDDLATLLDPDWMQVEIQFKARGGIEHTAQAYYGERSQAT